MINYGNVNSWQNVIIPAEPAKEANLPELKPGRFSNCQIRIYHSSQKAKWNQISSVGLTSPQIQI